MSKETTILVPGHEVPLDSIVSKTKGGKISQQTTLGKVILAAQDHGWTMKAGRSTYQKEDHEPEDLVWVEARKGPLWFRVTGTDCNWRGWTVTVNEIVDAIVNEKEEIPMRVYQPKVQREKDYE